MAGGLRLDRGTVRDRNHLPVVRPVPRLVRPDRVRRSDRLGADRVFGPVVSGGRGLGVGKPGAVRTWCRGKGQSRRVAGERGGEGELR